MNAKEKEGASREEIILWRFGCENMLARARSIREKEEQGLIKLKELAENDKYIRICGESYRAVSLNDKSPLCGFSNSGSKILDTIIKEHFEKTVKKLKEEVWKRKKERRLQNYLIKKALVNGRDLNKILKLKDLDELLFALDEVSMGDKDHSDENRPICRCDILAVGKQNGVYFPVLIELKSSRAKTELVNQLNNFTEEIKDDKEIRDAFIKLLEACTGKQIPPDEPIRKMIIWPSKASDKTMTELQGENIKVVEYEIDWEANNIELLEFMER